METESPLSPTKTYKESDNIAKPLAIAIIDRTIRDCVYLRKKEIKTFDGGRETTTNAKLKILTKEKGQMSRFLKSEFFSSLCELIGQDDYMMQTKILKILTNNKAAKTAAQALGMKFIFSVCVIITLAIIQPQYSYAQAFPPLSLFEPLPPTAIVEVTTLDSVHSVKLRVKCNGSTNTYRVPTYTYLTPTGEKVSYPFLVKGTDKAKHPITAKVKLWGKKLNLLSPYIVVLGSVVQILTYFKI